MSRRELSYRIDRLKAENRRLRHLAQIQRNIIEANRVKLTAVERYMVDYAEREARIEGMEYPDPPPAPLPPFSSYIDDKP